MGTDLRRFPLSKRVIDFLETHGIQTLFPPQEEALKSEVLKGKNLVLAAPTSSGKTLVAEICMVQQILNTGGKAIYLVPLKSLAREKYLDFRKYESLGLNISMSVGDYDSPGTRLQDADIMILTVERADSLLRHRPGWIQKLVVAVVDEVHLVTAPSRGPTLEMVIARLKTETPRLQILALSATISNARELAQWLGADLIENDWRPVPLKEGVFFDGQIHFRDQSVRNVPHRGHDESEDLVLDTIAEGGQCLVFVSNRKSTSALARRIAPLVRLSLDSESVKKLTTIAKTFGQEPSSAETSRQLSMVLRDGVAFHHAGLSQEERTIVEDCFKKNLLKVIVATPTLAAGVNLPARRTIVRDYRRFEEGLGNQAIPVLEFKQMGGRAGRPKYDRYGEAVLVAKTINEYEFLMDYYILSPPEDIESHLASEQTLRFHLLALIASDVVHDRQELDSLLGCTFYATRSKQTRLRHHINSALQFLADNDLITLDASDSMHATPLGECTSRLYISPESAIIFSSVFSNTETRNPLALLDLICQTPDQPITYVAKSELEEYESLFENELDELVGNTYDCLQDHDAFMKRLAQFKTACLLQSWISEASERELTEEYGVGMGDVHRFAESAEWLAHAGLQIAQLLGVHSYVPILQSLQTRLKHGVREDILQLVEIRNIGRVRGRMLHSHGFRSIADLYSAPLESIARVPTIGTRIALSIKKQLGFNIASTGSSDAEQSGSDSDTFQAMLDDF